MVSISRGARMILFNKETSRDGYSRVSSEPLREGKKTGERFIANQWDFLVAVWTIDSSMIT